MLRRRYEPAVAYHRSKLAQIMAAFDLAQRLPTGVTVNAIHPSTYMPTKLLAHGMDPKSSLDEGVDAVVALALDPTLQQWNGEYIEVTARKQAHPQAYDADARRRLREMSDRLIDSAIGH